MTRILLAVRILLVLSIAILPHPQNLQAQVPTPTPGGPRTPAPTPPPVVVTPRLSTYLYLSSTAPPQILGLTFTITHTVATTIDLTVTLDAPAMPGPNTTYPARRTITLAPDDLPVAPLLELTVPPATAPGTRACAVVTWTTDPGPPQPQTTRLCATVVGPDGAGKPTPTPRPAPTPTPAPTHPCWDAAQAALGKQGARYSQGGALTGDPRNPRTGQPYPRTGPHSFDCSGLIWWAYQQAGITVGTSTYTQIADGHALPCTLDDLQGDATRCWAPGDLIFLRYPGAQHVAMYVGSGLFMDCYNHQIGCVLHDVSQDRFYRNHFWQARRIISGCEGMTLDPGAPVPPPLPGAPEGDEVCVPDAIDWPDSGVAYHRGCGPPVLPPDPLTDDPDATGTTLRQFDGVVGWLGTTGRMWPPGTDGAHLHLGVATGHMTDACQWPNQLAGYPDGRRPPGADTCWTDWADPLAFLAQANQDTLILVEGTPEPVAMGQRGDASLQDAVLQLPPPGHPAGLILPPPDPDDPGGTWWSPGNVDRAEGADCPLGGPATTDWFPRLLQALLPWLFGC